MSAYDNSGSGTLDSPPPAYEYSKEDFDRKLAEAAEQSLSLSEHQNRSNTNDIAEEDRNESWDDTKQSQLIYNTRPDSRSNASLEPVRPLNIRKKNRGTTNSVDVTVEKERPAWYTEAQLPTSSSIQRRALPIPGKHHQKALSTQYDFSRESDRDSYSSRSPFTVVKNTLDGPPYDNHSGSKDLYRRSASPVIILQYNNEHRALSPVPSRSASPITNTQNRSRAVTPQPGPVSNGYHYAQQPIALQTRSSSKQQPSFNQSAPRMNFDPSVAYENTKASSTRYNKISTDKLEDKAQNAAALYSSAVAPLVSQKLLPTLAPKVKRYDSSTTAPPEYSPEATIQGSKTNQLYQQQDYSGSRVSFYSQSSVNTERVAQYPAQPAYNTSLQQRWSVANPQYSTQFYHR